MSLRSHAIRCLSLVLTAGMLPAAEIAPREPARIITEMCAGCHGPNLVGGPAPNLLDDVWRFGGDDESILRSIRTGFPQLGMAGYAGLLSEPEMRSLVTTIRQLHRRYALGMIPAVIPPPDSIIIPSERHTFRLETVAAPLNTPWGIVFLPDGTMLVSDRIGVLRTVVDGQLNPEPVRGTPVPMVRQDGGFLDLIAHPDFATNGWLYLAYSEAGDAARTSMTRIVRGRIRNHAWVDQEDIFRADQKYYYTDTSHYGCRFLFGPAGYLYFSIGDRGNALEAQDLTSPSGKIHRVFDDGRIPPDNPFVGRAGAWESIWSYGHRHVQGLQFHPVTGRLWATEHGPRGGDELNRIEPGRNYGWPIVSHGQPQLTEVIEGTARAGMESPVAWWTGIAPAAIEFSTSERFPRWRNHLFVAGLLGRQLRRIETDGDRVVHQEVLFSDLGRVRDVVVGPDGFIYVALNNPGRIARLVPAEPVP